MDKKEQEEWWTVGALASFILVSIAAVYNPKIAAIELGLIVVAIYVTPAFVAWERGHKNLLAIAVFNLFLGWTGLGWAVAMAWACTGL